MAFYSLLVSLLMLWAVVALCRRHDRAEQRRVDEALKRMRGEAPKPR